MWPLVFLFLFAANVDARACQLTTFYPTGVNDAGVPLAINTLDSHYVYCAATSDNCAAPIAQAMATGAGNQWLGAMAGGGSIGGGAIWFRTVWNHTSLKYCKNIQCTLSMEADDYLMDITVNGISQSPPQLGYGAFGNAIIADFHFGQAYAPNVIAVKVADCCGAPTGVVARTVTCTGTDIDECASNNPCPTGTTCIDQVGGPPVCQGTPTGCSPACGAGYNCSVSVCIDVNECATSPSPCGASSTCTNTPGSFSCACSSGYASSCGTPTPACPCAPINVCLTSPTVCGDSSTGHACQSTGPGTYTCSCSAGYRATCSGGSSAPCTCDDINECASTPSPCGSAATGNRCTNTLGSWTCGCATGYAATSTPCNGTTTTCACQDVNECATSAMLCGTEPGALCTNTPGAWQCSCDVGFRSGQACAGTTLPCQCQDINECATSPSPCDDDGGNSPCTNTVGSFVCACASGYVASTPSCGGPAANCACVDVNECATTPSVCGSGPGATCLNTIGAWQCTCLSGFTSSVCDASPTSPCVCTDVNECTAPPSVCGNQGTCTNTVGSFTCGCAAGYEPSVPACGGGSGVSCVCQDVNECITTTPCPASVTTCQNTPGSFVCNDVDECIAGTDNCDRNTQICQNRDQTGFVCLDRDECADGSNTCVPGFETCRNTLGGFACDTVDQCATNNGGCPMGVSTCQNRPQQVPLCVDINECAVSGSNSCDPITQQCINGINDGYTCLTIDPCSLGINGGCPAGTTCFAQTGGGGTTVECVDPAQTDLNLCHVNNGGCAVGMTTCAWNTTSDPNVVVCVDVNECAVLNGGCITPYETCMNRNGTGSICDDVNECAVNGATGCPVPYATCVNQPGGPPTCLDVNTCATNHGGCNVPFETCIDTPLGPPSCVDVNECAVTPNGGCVASTCVDRLNTTALCVPIAYCATNNGGCPFPWSMCHDVDFQTPTCTDINECASNNGGCNGTCDNLDQTAPGFTCTEKIVTRVTETTASSGSSSIDWTIMGVAVGICVCLVLVCVYCIRRACHDKASDTWCLWLRGRAIPRDLSHMRESIKDGEVEMEDMRHVQSTRYSTSSNSPGSGGSHGHLRPPSPRSAIGPSPGEGERHSHHRHPYDRDSAHTSGRRSRPTTPLPPPSQMVHHDILPAGPMDPATAKLKPIVIADDGNTIDGDEPDRIMESVPPPLPISIDQLKRSLPPVPSKWVPPIRPTHAKKFDSMSTTKGTVQLLPDPDDTDGGVDLDKVEQNGQQEEEEDQMEDDPYDTMDPPHIAAAALPPQPAAAAPVVPAPLSVVAPAATPVVSTPLVAQARELSDEDAHQETDEGASDMV